MKRHRSRDKEGRRGKASSLKSRNERNHLETRRRHPEPLSCLQALWPDKDLKAVFLVKKQNKWGLQYLRK